MSKVTTYEGTPPVLSQIAIIIIAILAVLAIIFGVLWGMAFFGPDYKRQSATLQEQVTLQETESQQLRSISAALKTQLGQPLQYGFEVQIGAFEAFDISAEAENLVRMAEVNENGLNKYVLGRFTDLTSAKKFLSDLKKMGLYDAFIAGVVDGKRATVKEAQAAASKYYGN